MKTFYTALLGTTVVLLNINNVAQAQYLTTNANAEDLCTDIVAGNQQQDILSTEQGESSSTASSRYRQTGGGGGVSFLGIGIRGQGQRTTRHENQSSSTTSSEYFHDKSSVTYAAVGRNCDEVVRQLGETQRTQIDADVNHHLIDSRETINLREIEAGSQDRLFQMMMQGF